MSWEFIVEANVSSKWCSVIISEFDQSNAFLLRWSNGHLFFLRKPHHDHTKSLLSSTQGETTFQIIAETSWTSKMGYAIKIKPWKKSLSPSSSAIFSRLASRGGGGGYSIYPWVGRCGLAPHTLTLFKKKIADFPTLFKKEFRFLIPCLIHLTRNHTLCKVGRTSPLSRYKGVPPPPGLAL